MRCLFIRILYEFQLKMALLIVVAARSHIHVIVEPRTRSLVILPYGTMAAVESTTAVIVLVYDCCEHFVPFGGLCE